MQIKRADGRVTVSECYAQAQALTVAADLIAGSRWFEVEPLPFDQFRISVKPETTLPDSAPGVWFSIETDGDGVETCNLAEFLVANADADDLCTWARCANVGERYEGGGGAAPHFIIERIS